MNWLGLDIGGANLKIADGRGYAASYPFSMWRDRNYLAEAIRYAIHRGPTSDHLAVTMTGELADCFSSKAQGVQAIVQTVAVEAGHRAVYIYGTDGSFSDVAATLAAPRLAAASNWHALARYCGRFAAPDPVLLIDIGSTTVDLVPLVDSQPAGHAFSDTDRLLAQELVYTGVTRSPVCALVRGLPYRGQSCPVAQELFATTHDVYLLLGHLDEDPANRQTADLQPATCEAATRRMARMICADHERFDPQDARQSAQAVAAAQITLILDAIRAQVARWPHAPQTVILSGEGEFLGQQVVTALGWRCTVVSLAEQIGPLPSRCGPAHALAVLAAESLGV